MECFFGQDEDFYKVWGHFVDLCRHNYISQIEGQFSKKSVLVYFALYYFQIGEYGADFKNPDFGPKKIKRVVDGSSFDKIREIRVQSEALVETNG